MVSCSLCMPIHNETKSITIEDYFEDLRYYYKMISSVIPKLIMTYGFDKLLNVGRILIINYIPLGLIGRLAVLLQVFNFFFVFYLQISKMFNYLI